VLGFQGDRPALLADEPLFVGPFRDIDERRRMACPHGGRLSRLDQAFPRILPDGLEQRVARLVAAVAIEHDERLLDQPGEQLQRRELVGVVRCDARGVWQRPPPAKTDNALSSWRSAPVSRS